MEKKQISHAHLPFEGKSSTDAEKTSGLLCLLSEIINNITAGIYLAKVTDGTIVYTNPKCEKMFGYASGEMIGKNSTALYAPADSNPGPTRDEIRDFITKDGEWHGEVSRIRKDGSIFWSYSNSTIIDQTEYGQVFVIVHTDISDLKIGAGSEKNKAEERKYLSLFMTSRDALMTLEPPSWSYTSGNPAAVKMFRAKNEAEFLSYGPWKLSPAKQADGQPSVGKAKAMIAKAMQEGSNFFEWTHRRVDGEDFMAEVMLSRVEQGEKTYLLASVHDINERKNAQNSLEKFNHVMVGRELKMTELKQEISDLKKIIEEKSPHL